MSTHEIKASDLSWAKVHLSDTDEARSHLKLITEELREIKSDPLQTNRVAELEAAESELSDLLMRDMFDLI